ncbi:MAG: TraR/DksA C4-type zinc finger protein [Alphaproteobacteria bacterium]|nr:TraR/DksA C4-type zinc finger protein [Alphaproteobacteria bacterium]
MAAARADLNDLGQVREVEADAIDFASTETDREQRLRFADRERKLAGKIRVALQRMQEGEYGVCESCGEPITFKRLLARPIATQCIDCKTQAEQLERRSRVY